ncbi:MAG: hypothetical protein AB4038_00145 [Prochloraceae cyanobacterium]
MSNNNSDSVALFAESGDLFQDLSPSEESMVTGGKLKKWQRRIVKQFPKPFRPLIRGYFRTLNRLF